MLRRRAGPPTPTTPRLPLLSGHQPTPPGSERSGQLPTVRWSSQFQSQPPDAGLASGACTPGQCRQRQKYRTCRPLAALHQERMLHLASIRRGLRRNRRTSSQRSAGCQPRRRTPGFAPASPHGPRRLRPSTSPTKTTPGLCTRPRHFPLQKRQQSRGAFGCWATQGVHQTVRQPPACSWKTTGARQTSPMHAASTAGR